MKNNIFFLSFFCIVISAKAQTINIPDANFKAKLLQANTSSFIAQNSNNANIKIDTNNDGEIQVSEALLVFRLNVQSSDIDNLTGIESFINLQILSCDNNQLDSLNVIGLTNLQQLFCFNNQLISLDTSGLISLQVLNCHNNQLNYLNLNELTSLQVLNCFNNQLMSLVVNELNLEILGCSNNHLITLDLCGSSNMFALNCSNNELISLFIKNNNSYWGWSDFNFENNINLEYVCADEEDIELVQGMINQYGYTNCHVNSYCSFTPGGTFYTIQGENRIDFNVNGCDNLDTVYPNLKFNISNGSVSGDLVSNSSGNYSIPVQAGTHTIAPQLENPTYFNISPTSTIVSFPATASPFLQNICITPNGVVHDLEIVIIPISVARPGFDATYKIKYKNKGNQIANGVSINFNYDDAVLNFISSSILPSSQSVNVLSFTIVTIQPLESGEFIVRFNVNSPIETPAVNIGDLLNYSATISSLENDLTPINNSFSYTQTVVGSYDPNDKECLQGSIINISMIGNYVHYKIRFENTGTFAAQNVVIKDMLDASKFELSTLQLTDASHSCIIRITNPNKVEFIFENINLPFDDATNDGYVVFKIKTKSTLAVNSTISNNANIYFDYNFPIVTNTVTSTFTTLGNNEFENTSVVVYPNPTNSNINITSNDLIKTVELYDIQGRLLMTQINDSQTAIIELSNQNTGTYFVKVITDNGLKVEKLIKE